MVDTSLSPQLNIVVEAGLNTSLCHTKFAHVLQEILGEIGVEASLASLKPDASITHPISTLLWESIELGKKALGKSCDDSMKGQLIDLIGQRIRGNESINHLLTRSLLAQLPQEGANLIASSHYLAMYAPAKHKVLMGPDLVNKGSTVNSFNYDPSMYILSPCRSFTQSVIHDQRFLGSSNRILQVGQPVTNAMDDSISLRKTNLIEARNGQRRPKVFIPIGGNGPELGEAYDACRFLAKKDIPTTVMCEPTSHRFNDFFEGLNELNDLAERQQGSRPISIHSYPRDQRDSHMQDWMSHMSDASFTHLITRPNGSGGLYGMALGFQCLFLNAFQHHELQGIELLHNGANGQASMASDAMADEKLPFRNQRELDGSQFINAISSNDLGRMNNFRVAIGLTPV